MTAPHGPRSLRGFGLVEILVALALGLFLVGTAISVFVAQLGEHRRRLLEARVTQELRGALALIESDLRRAGYWDGAAGTAWQAGANAPVANPHTALFPAQGDSAVLGHGYADDEVQHHGFRLNANTRALEMRLAGAAITPGDGDSWQPMTDPATVRITRFVVRTTPAALDLGARCTAPCPAGASSCPPTQTLRLVSIELEGRATLDATVQRAYQSNVRVRTDPVVGTCPAR